MTDEPDLAETYQHLAGLRDSALRLFIAMHLLRQRHPEDDPLHRCTERLRVILTIFEAMPGFTLH